MSRRKQWFIDRIGTKIFLAGWDCTCDICNHERENGYKIDDELVAIELYSFESDLRAEGCTDIYFYETKEGRDNAEKINRRMASNNS